MFGEALAKRLRPCTPPTSPEVFDVGDQLLRGERPFFALGKLLPSLAIQEPGGKGGVAGIPDQLIERSRAQTGEAADDRVEFSDSMKFAGLIHLDVRYPGGMASGHLPTVEITMSQARCFEPKP
jgi:hypothetical protein